MNDKKFDYENFGAFSEINEASKKALERVKEAAGLSIAEKQHSELMEKLKEAAGITSPDTAYQKILEDLKSNSLDNSLGVKSFEEAFRDISGTGSAVQQLMDASGVNNHTAIMDAYFNKVSAAASLSKIAGVDDIGKHMQSLVEQFKSPSISIAESIAGKIAEEVRRASESFTARTEFDIDSLVPIRMFEPTAYLPPVVSYDPRNFAQEKIEQIVEEFEAGKADLKEDEYLLLSVVESGHEIIVLSFQAVDNYNIKVIGYEGESETTMTIPYDRIIILHVKKTSPNLFGKKDKDIIH